MLASTKTFLIIFTLTDDFFGKTNLRVQKAVSNSQAWFLVVLFKTFQRQGYNNGKIQS